MRASFFIPAFAAGTALAPFGFPRGGCGAQVQHGGQLLGRDSRRLEHRRNTRVLRQR
jgi:hypothetical protein